MGQRRGLCLKLLLAAGLCVLPGCFGVTQNPSYFPHLLPTGDIIQTHAKPPGPSYFANFDPHAVHLEVRPLESTDPVRSQHVLIATVYDEKGLPRRDRRVEWMLEGVGNIIEVDESGLFPGRGYKVDNKYAVSYTAYHEHRITRGNANPNDDFVIRPGQTWCVISSAVEGDSHVTAYAPEIANWDAHKVFVTKHWVDAEWIIPAPSVNRAGTEHVVTTIVFRHTDRQPLANYRVRYRILDGPPAVFLPNRTQEMVVISDLSGNANASLVQVAPQPGINRIGIEIIRPPDPTSPSGAGIIIGRGETTKEWQGAQLSFSITGPPTASIGQDIPYTIAIANNGQVETQAMTVREVLPEGVQLIRSEPRAVVEGNQLVWTLGQLPGGRTHAVQVVLRGARVGPVTNCASVTTVEGFHDEKCITTQITQAAQVAQPQLRVSMSDVPNAAVGVPFTYQISVSNPGTGPVNNVLLSASFDAGLEHETRANPVELPLGTLGAGENRPVPLTLVARQAGKFVTRVTATGDGNLKSDAQATVVVQTGRLSISKTGPSARYVDQTATWDITVANQGDAALNNVVVRDTLPPEVSFQNATELGQFINGQVVWNIGALPARTQKVVQVAARCMRIAPHAVNTAEVTADPGLQERADSVLEIRGVPAFLLEVTKAGDPALVGGKVVYKVAVTNTGSLPGNQVEVVATVPGELQVINSDGPTRAKIDKNQVLFPAIDALQPKQTVTYIIEAQALKPGDVRFRVELRSASLREPVIKEESTNIYVPPNGTGTAPAAPPAAQPGGVPQAQPGPPPVSPPAAPGTIPQQ
jgi:uncharacterized repeat protein (TIGR01451 family)